VPRLEKDYRSGGAFRPGRRNGHEGYSIALVAIATSMSAPASAATTDPEVIIYRFPGVKDDGGAANIGTATVFHCTNFSGVNETIRFVTRAFDGTLLTNNTSTVVHLGTRTVSTHSTIAYFEDLALETGQFQGTTRLPPPRRTSSVRR
jgi:hypothetical protein